MIIDTTQTKVERQMEHRLHFPIREDTTVLRGQKEDLLTIFWANDPYPSEVGAIIINDYKIIRLAAGER